MMRLRNPVILWVLGALLIFVVFSAARIGAADFISGYVRNEMAAWTSSAVSPDASKLDNVARALVVAQWIAPDNPDHYEDMARLELVRAGLSGVAARTGLAPIRQAIALRPASAYSWAILLRLKNELGEHDAEFRRSLERTVTLGPWEPNLQLVVAEAGWSAWAELPDAEREMVRENQVRGMKRQAAAMLAIAQAYPQDCGDDELNADCSQ